MAGNLSRSLVALPCLRNPLRWVYHDVLFNDLLHFPQHTTSALRNLPSLMISATFQVCPGSGKVSVPDDLLIGN